MTGSIVSVNISVSDSWWNLRFCASNVGGDNDDAESRTNIGTCVKKKHVEKINDNKKVFYRTSSLFIYTSYICHLKTSLRSVEPCVHSSMMTPTQHYHRRATFVSIPNWR